MTTIQNPFILKFGEHYITLDYDSIQPKIKDAIVKYLPIQSGTTFPLIDLIATYAQHHLLYKIPPKVLTFLRARCTVSGWEALPNFKPFFALPILHGESLSSLVQWHPAKKIPGFLPQVCQRYGHTPFPKGWAIFSCGVIPYSKGNPNKPIPDGFTLVDPGLGALACVEVNKQTNHSLFSATNTTRVNGQTQGGSQLGIYSTSSEPFVFVACLETDGFAIQKLFLEE